MRKLLAIVAVGLIGVYAPRAPLTAQQATFTASTEAIWVTATAIDKDGHLVTDLTKGDFEVRDRGVVRDIITYRNDVVPFALSVMIDVSQSMEGNAATLRRGLAELVGRFEPGDRAIIGAFSFIPVIGDRFSGNGGVLRRELIDVMTSPAAYCSGDWLSLGQRMNGQGQLAILGGSAIWDGIACGVSAVASDAETPRRVALVITDGMDNGSVSTQANVIDLANRYGVMIYVIGMSGEQGLAMPALSGMAEQTGGGYFYLNSRDDMVDAFAHIAEELRHQYLFGFAPDAVDKDHQIDVRVKRPGVTTRSRRVYLTTRTGVATSAAATPSAAPR